jgi:hypothetical protein
LHPYKHLPICVILSTKSEGSFEIPHIRSGYGYCAKASEYVLHYELSNYSKNTNTINGRLEDFYYWEESVGD